MTMNMKKVVMALTVMTSAVLTACGGGGSSNLDSSFSETILNNGVSYLCKSENAANKCKNGDCSLCESELDKIITASCSSRISSGQTIYAVSNSGCVATMKSGSKLSALCDGSILKIKTGSGYSLNQINNSGTAYASGEYVSALTAETLSCR